MVAPPHPRQQVPRHRCPILPPGSAWRASRRGGHRATVTRRVSAVPPGIRMPLPQLRPALRHVGTGLPQVHPALPQVDPALPEVHPALPHLRTMLPQVHPALPEVHTALPQVQTAAALARGRARPHLPGPHARPIMPGPNNAKQLEVVSRNRQILVNILGDAEALALAAALDRDAAFFEEGTALADVFLAEYGERDDATGTRTGTRKGLKAADKAARDTYNTLRALLRDEYADAPEHLERLGVSAPRAPGDRDTFLEAARATLAAVRKAPYAAAVARARFPTKALDAFGASLDALQTAAGGKTSAEGAHGGGTEERNAAYSAFTAWMEKARRRLDIAYADHPAVARRVGL